MVDLILKDLEIKIYENYKTIVNNGGGGECFKIQRDGPTDDNS